MSARLLRRTSNPDLSLPESLHPLLRRIYSQRPLGSADELQLSLDQLHSPALFSGMDAAVALLLAALEQRKRMLLVADFDADGATSCALAITALRQFGAVHVDYIVPNRFDYGYGLTPEIVALAAGKNPDLIITVDNGISSLDGVAAAKQAGMQVLITDHHLPAQQLPAADAIVNPNQPDCAFPSKSIAGVGVIFYVMLALRSRLRELDWFQRTGRPEPNMGSLLDLVALGTVADVVALDRNNRILVDQGLKRIRSGRTRPGIAALIQVAGRNATRIGASDLGFFIGPRLNAAGRLEDMSIGIECLLADSGATAHALALQLDGMNQDRKQIEAGMREQAFATLQRLEFATAELPAGICLFDEDWHQGVVGILASRIKDRYHRPVIAFAVMTENDCDDSQLKGSARSIKGFHIRDALDAIASRHPGLINKFGGHAMAAGLSLPREQFPAFRAAFEEETARQLDADQLQATLHSDGELEPDWLSMATVELLDAAGPWGQEFPEPLFDGTFTLLQQRKVGEKHLKMVLCPPGLPQRSIDAIAFNVEDERWPAADCQEIAIAYRIDINEYRGRCTLQLIVEQIL